LRQGKAHTHAIERNNGRQRHWLARFKRRSIVVSKSLSMIDVSMTLFAYFQEPQNLRSFIALL
jgi:insertion element IS1 protein InsB